MSVLTISPPTTSVISSPGSAFGPTRFDALGGLTIAEFGQVLAPANLSARQAKAAGLLTSGIYGPRFFHLITQCRPDVVVGEQVASRDGLAWLDLVQADAKNQNEKDMSAVREVLSQIDRRVPPQVLQPGMYGESVHENARNQGSGSISSAEHVQSGSMRGLRTNGAIFTQAPQGPKPDEQHPGEYRDTLRELPFEGARPPSCGCCGKESDWLADAVFRGNRVGRLRGYGNAINAEQAEGFLRAALT